MEEPPTGVKGSNVNADDTWWLTSLPRSLHNSGGILFLWYTLNHIFAIFRRMRVYESHTLALAHCHLLSQMRTEIHFSPTTWRCSEMGRWLLDGYVSELLTPSDNRRLRTRSGRYFSFKSKRTWKNLHVSWMHLKETYRLSFFKNIFL